MLSMRLFIYVRARVCVRVCVCVSEWWELSVKTDDEIVVSLFFCIISPGHLQPLVACLNLFIKLIIYTNHNDD